MPECGPPKILRRRENLPEPMDRRPAPPPAIGCRDLHIVRDNATHGLKLGALVQGGESQYRVTQLDAGYHPNSNRCMITIKIGLQRERAPAPIEELLAKLERIPCVSEDCDGPGDCFPASKDGVSATQCHRCAATRLGRSVLDGH